MAQPSIIALPALPPGFPPELQAWADQIKNQIEAVLTDMTQPAQRYAVTNVSSPPSRTLDATAATLAELRQVVGALITDLQTRGVLTR